MQNLITKKVTLFYANWCGHCHQFLPQWKLFMAAYEKSKDEIKNKYKIELITNDYEDSANPQKAIESNVDGFPTILIQYNDKTDKYIGERTAKALFKKLIPEATDEDITSFLQKVNNNNLQTGGSNLQTSGSNLQTNGSNLQTNGSNLRTNGSNLRTNGSNLRTNGSNLRTGLNLIDKNNDNIYNKYLKYKRKCIKYNYITKN